MSVIASNDKRSGFDGVAFLSFLTVYIQVKCSRDGKTRLKDIRRVLAVAVHNALKFHCNTFGLAGAELEKLSDVHLVFYEWHENENDFDKEEVIALFQRRVENQRRIRQQVLEAQPG